MFCTFNDVSTKEELKVCKMEQDKTKALHEKAKDMEKSFR